LVDIELAIEFVDLFWAAHDGSLFQEYFNICLLKDVFTDAPEIVEDFLVGITVAFQFGQDLVNPIPTEDKLSAV
jgi:hypothetical protein